MSPLKEAVAPIVTKQVLRADGIFATKIVGYIIVIRSTFKCWHVGR